MKPGLGDKLHIGSLKSNTRVLVFSLAVSGILGSKKVTLPYQISPELSCVKSPRGHWLCIAGAPPLPQKSQGTQRSDGKTSHQL